MEELVVFGLVASAALYLGARILRRHRKEAGCGDCGGKSDCSVSAALPNDGVPWNV